MNLNLNESYNHHFKGDWWPVPQDMQLLWYKYVQIKSDWIYIFSKVCFKIQFKWLGFSGEYGDVAASPKILVADAYAPSNRC